MSSLGPIAPLLLLAACLATLAVAAPASTLPRGVAPAAADRYAGVRSGAAFRCLDGTKAIAASRVNDDYCDCADGSDEPGTAACARGSFHCLNRGHQPVDLPAWAVNDGVCDCCDGTDEYNTPSAGCKNTCLNAAGEQLALFEANLAAQQVGLAAKAAFVALAAAELPEKEKELAALLAEKQELLTREAQAKSDRTAAEEAARRAREAREAQEATELSAQQASDRENGLWEVDQEEEEHRDEEAGEGDDAEEREEEVHIVPTGDLELDAQAEFDVLKAANERRLRNSHLLRGQKRPVPLSEPEEAKVKEVKEKRVSDVLRTRSDELIRLTDLETEAREVLLSHDRNEKQREEEAEQREREREADIDNDEESNHHHRDDEEQNEDDEEEEENAFIAFVLRIGRAVARTFRSFSSVFKRRSHKKKASSKAATVSTTLSREVADLNRRMTDIEKLLALDLGPQNEFYGMYHKMTSAKFGEYEYHVNGFASAKQGHTDLGAFEKWDGPAHTAQLYTGGTACWNGPARSAHVLLECGDVNKLLEVTEPNKCEYHIRMATPASCSEQAAEQLRAKIADLRELLRSAGKDEL